ncbi:SGNH/GDSL hydrolase family protein [Sinorhizobium chiapasense]|uniref:SGNH/GDSL hydrolase family protein n=1 Tax=Sinorhizobium chiapasense TaxID=501572 RepID=A0ABZ2BHI4_9HYPH
MTKRYLGFLACALPALYLLLGPVYALLHFEEYASETPHFIRYVLVPGLLGMAFAIVGLFAKPSISGLVGTCGLSVLLALFLFEAKLTATTVSVRLGMLGQYTEEQDEALGRTQDVVRGFTLRRLNRLSGTNELSKALLSGFPSTQVVLCTSESGIVSYTADRYGFNNPDHLYEKHLDLMLLGDSFVEGFCLPPGEDLAARLRDGGLATASMGMRGNGPLIELATLGRFGDLLQPRLVLMTFFEGNDWENLKSELAVPWLRTVLSPDANYGSQATAEETIRLARIAAAERSRDAITVVDVLTRTALLRNFIALQQTFTRLGLTYPKVAAEIPEFRQTLHRAKALTESWGGTFALVYVPRLDRFMGPLSTYAPFDQLRTRVLDSAAAEGIEVIDLYEAFRGRSDPAHMYAPDGHFSREGASIAAQVILLQLQAMEKTKPTAGAKEPYAQLQSRPLRTRVDAY